MNHGQFKKHFPVLDVLRGIAALSVFAHHYYQQYFLEANHANYIGAIFSHLGPWGVTIFFVLSGFCIHWGRLTDRNVVNGFSVKAFAIRRFFRIYPAFLGSILICFFIENYYTSNLLPKSSPFSVLAHLSLFSSFMVDQRVAVNNVLWSVVVECHFYIIYAICWQYFSGIKKSLTMLGVAIVAGLITFIASVLIFPSGPYRVMMQSMFLSSWWIWCIGVLIAELIFHDKNLFSSPSLNRFCFLLALTLSIVICLLPQPLDLFGRRFILPFMSGAFLYFLLKDEYEFEKLTVLVFIGMVSYSLYLFHPLAILVSLHTGLDRLTNIFITILLGILMAYVGYRLFELPFVKAGKKVLNKFK